jgi:hypothetical protein
MAIRASNTPTNLKCLEVIEVLFRVVAAREEKNLTRHKHFREANTGRAKRRHFTRHKTSPDRK